MNVINLTASWLEHLKTCTNCESWWLNGGTFVRCPRGWALSEVLTEELERAMPADEPAIRSESHG